MKFILSIIPLLLLQNCIFFQALDRDNPYDPKNDVEVIRDGLEHWFKLDGNLNDSIGGASASVPTQPPQWAEDRYQRGARSLRLEQESPSLTVTSSFLPSVNYTVEFKVSFMDAALGQVLRLVETPNPSNNVIISFETSNIIKFSFLPGPPVDEFLIGISSTLNTQLWQSLFLTVESKGPGIMLQLYFANQGEEIKKVAEIPRTPILFDMFIFGYNDQKIDDLRFYNRILSEEEMQQNHVSAGR